MRAGRGVFRAGAGAGVAGARPEQDPVTEFLPSAYPAVTRYSVTAFAGTCAVMVPFVVVA